MALRHIAPVVPADPICDRLEHIEMQLAAIQGQLARIARPHGVGRRSALDHLIWAVAGAVAGGWAVALVFVVPELLR